MMITWWLGLWLIRDCLGDGETSTTAPRETSSAAPSAAVEGFGRSVAAGAYCSFAIGLDGELYAWGKNEYGKLGLGNTEDQPLPTKVGLKADSVSAGRYHTMAIDQEGAVWTWGHNNVGQLGTGDTDDLSQPFKVLASGATQIAAGEAHCLAVLHGVLVSWGHQSNGQLGRTYLCFIFSAVSFFLGAWECILQPFADTASES